MPPTIDRTGMTYGVLRVLGRGETRGTWRVRCEHCAVEWVVSNRFFAAPDRGPTTHLACRRERRRQRGQIV